MESDVGLIILVERLEPLGRPRPLVGDDARRSVVAGSKRTMMEFLEGLGNSSFTEPDT